MTLVMMAKKRGGSIILETQRSIRGIAEVAPMVGVLLERPEVVAIVIEIFK